ncbi:sigma-70 family RNA polymerase sigma factor [Aquirhabdus sp.]|uniref:sigma-70 family RNA polymerase sigma factor n=1 Tax=Aquirhabdus sp. TaxID=2824160 RepID=UPI00396CBE6A
MFAPLVDEQTLLLQIGQGNRQAFRQLYDQTSPHLFAVALRLLRKRDSAEEVLQEVFLTIWHAADQYDIERGSVRTWLSTITRNRCIDRIRRAPVETLPLQDDDALTSEKDDPLTHVLYQDHHALLSVCLGELDEQQRHCVSLAFFDGMTHQEVATHLTVPLGSAKTWIRRGLEFLKKCMGAL